MPAARAKNYLHMLGSEDQLCNAYHSVCSLEKCRTNADVRPLIHLRQRDRTALDGLPECTSRSGYDRSVACSTWEAAVVEWSRELCTGGESRDSSIPDGTTAFEVLRLSQLLRAKSSRAQPGFSLRNIMSCEERLQHPLLALRSLSVLSQLGRQLTWTQAP